jgi:tetratricopeptide (TPR) repeat protein
MNPVSQTLDALYATGHWLVAQGRHRDALDVFRTMLYVDGADERGWLALATCHAELDEHDKAIALCRLAPQACERGAVRCTIARARFHRCLGDADDARDAFEAAACLADGDEELEALVSQEGRAP